MARNPNESTGATQTSLRHATHHLKQLYWLMRNKLDITPQAPATGSDMQGISTPSELFEMEN
jgi:hypothetical protein